MTSSMKREAYYRLCEVAWTLQQHPTQGRKLDRFRHQLVFSDAGLPAVFAFRYSRLLLLQTSSKIVALFSVNAERLR